MGLRGCVKRFKTVAVALRQAQSEGGSTFVVSLSSHERLILAHPLRVIMPPGITLTPPEGT